MALNLNKGGEEDPKQIKEKKSLNLSKSGDTEKPRLNLSKEKSASNEAASVQSGSKEPAPNRKRLVLYIVLGLFIGGTGLFWFLNKGTATEEQIANMNEDNSNSLAPAQVEEVESPPNNNLNIQEEANSVGPSVAESSENSASNAPETNAAVSSNNVSESNSVANSISTQNAIQPSTNTSTPSIKISADSIEEKVKQVIRGDFGIGKSRKKALGADYASIQAKVNEWYSNKGK